MTHRGTIGLLDEVKQIYLHKPHSYGMVSALNMAIQALEKQIPKKSITISSITYIPACPQCKRTVITYEKCCSECGQALDWSDEE